MFVLLRKAGLVASKQVKIVGRTENQTKYIQTINSHTVTICHGPAGSGKTFIACALAAKSLLKACEIKRIVLTRPTTSCGEDIGFLPGTIAEKIGPYLMPLFDELRNFIRPEEMTRMLQDRTIEIVPLAMMRGRTFKESFIILDEAQNAIYAELKMFFTRLGESSKMVVNGDPEQQDINDNAFSRITRQLEHVDGVGVSCLTGEDVVRHGLIPRMLTVMKG